MRRIPWGRVALMLLGTIVLGGLVYAFLPKPVGVDLAEVERGELIVTVDEDGITRIKKWSAGSLDGVVYRREPFRYTISAPVAGELRQILLEPGDAVRAGEVVAVIEANVPPLLDPRAVARAEAKKKAAEAAKEQAEIQEKRAKAAYDLAKRNYDRTLQLPPAAVSREELDAAENAVQLAREEWHAAKMAVKVAEYEVQVANAVLLHAKSTARGRRRFEIASPLAGKVLRVLKEFGGPVQPGTELLEVGDTRELEVVVDVLSEDAVKLEPNDKVYLERWGGEFPLIGRVRRIEPRGRLKVSALGVEEQRVDVIIDFDEQENAKRDPKNLRKRLGDGYRVLARMTIWRGNNVVKVPAGALFRRNGNWALFVVENGRARLRSVKVGRSNGVWTQILSGAEPGETVILHPSDAVADGTRVYQR